MHNNIFAIIPARGGSKRFPGKNVALLAGKPLICHSIDFAWRFLPRENVFVSTDDAEIESVAVNYGANVLKRPIALAQDQTPTSDVIAYHANKWKNEGVLTEYILLLQPTNPIRPHTILEQALNIIASQQRQSVVTYSPLNKKFGLIREDKFFPENYTPGQRMQDIEPRYFENGLLYLFTSTLALKGEIFGDDPYPLIMDGIEGTVDIDEPDDMAYAEWLIQHKI